jgi:glycerate 2-kinase
MKIITAPDSFKGSICAADVCLAMEKGILRVVGDATIDKIPLADGGEGTVNALVSATGGRFRVSRITGPLGTPVNATWGVLGDGTTVVIEMAAASGLTLIPAEKRNPLCTTSYGTGELIKEAVRSGCRKIILGIGGSATTDFGTGMAQALGVRFYNSQDREITEFMNGSLMGEVRKIEMHGIRELGKSCEIMIACDVDNPLLGPQGAVSTYSPQKGATPEMCMMLERNMHSIADVAAQYGEDVREKPGSGAAGGLGGGAMVFLKAILESGIQLVLGACHFEQRIQNSDIILTGEGAIDMQTAHGKVIAGVAGVARKHDIPVVAVAGKMAVDSAVMDQMGVTACFSLCREPMTVEQSMNDAPALIEGITEQIIRLCVRKKVNFNKEWT